MEKLSVLIPCFNNEDIIRDCLESVKWADEILVVDSYSTDGTLDIVREYTERIIKNPFVGYAQQKNLAIPQCSYNWVLQIDTDERLEPGLEEEIRSVLKDSLSGIDAYRIPRKNHVLGVWVRQLGIYPDYQTRLFRKSVGRFREREVHEYLEVPGGIGVLKHHILHYGMTSISKQIRNLDRYTACEADEMRKLNKSFHWYDLLLRPPAIFSHRYFWKLGFMAGYRGLVLSVYLAFYIFLAYAKLWEKQWQAGLRR